MFLVQLLFYTECIECFAGVVSRNVFCISVTSSRGPNDYWYDEVFRIPQ